MQAYEKAFEGKQVLITGGLGFIGSNLAHRLVSLGAGVTIVDSLIPQYGGNLHNIHEIADQVKLNIADVRDIYSMNTLVQRRDFIFNLAGQVSHLSSMVDPFPDLEINCKAQLIILEACRHHNADVKIVYAGSRSEYGRVQSLPVKEDHPLNPVDVNGINNIAGERYHLLYNDIYGIRAVSLRLTNTYGPRHSMERPDQSFLNWFVRLAIDRRTIEIFGDGQQLRDFNYIDDVVDALLMTAADERANGQVFNLGAREPVSVLDVTQMLIGIAGGGRFEFVPFPEERKKIEIGNYWGDFSKIRALLGWTPRVSLQDGLARTVAFYRANRQYYWQ